MINCQREVYNVGNLWKSHTNTLLNFVLNEEKVIPLHPCKYISRDRKYVGCDGRGRGGEPALGAREGASAVLGCHATTRRPDCCIDQTPRGVPRTAKLYPPLPNYENKRHLPSAI